MAVQLRVGGMYRNGKGKTVGPLGRFSLDDDEFCFVDEQNRTYKMDGKWSMDDTAHPLDLIEEIVDEEVPAKQMQVLVAGEWEDVVQWGLMRVVDGMQGMYFFKYGALDHGWFSADYMREKPVKKKHRVVRYVSLYADGQVGNDLYDNKAECEQLSITAPCELREVVFEWESE